MTGASGCSTHPTRSTDPTPVKCLSSPCCRRRRSMGPMGGSAGSQPHVKAVRLHRDGQNQPWGIRLVGGVDLNAPLVITRVRKEYIVRAARGAVSHTYYIAPPRPQLRAAGKQPSIFTGKEMSRPLPLWQRHWRTGARSRNLGRVGRGRRGAPPASSLRWAGRPGASTAHRDAGVVDSGGAAAGKGCASSPRVGSTPPGELWAWTGVAFDLPHVRLLYTGKRNVKSRPWFRFIPAERRWAVGPGAWGLGLPTAQRHGGDLRA